MKNVLDEIKQQADNVEKSTIPRMRYDPLNNDFDDDEVDIIDENGNTTMSLDKRKDYLVFMDGVKDGTIELQKPIKVIKKKIVSVDIK